MAVETSHEADVTALEKLAAELTARRFETHLAVPQGHVPSSPSCTDARCRCQREISR